MFLLKVDGLIFYDLILYSDTFGLAYSIIP